MAYVNITLNLQDGKWLLLGRALSEKAPQLCCQRCIDGALAYI